MDFDGEAFAEIVLVFILVMLLFFGTKEIPVPLFPAE